MANPYDDFIVDAQPAANPYDDIIQAPAKQPEAAIAGGKKPSIGEITGRAASQGVTWRWSSEWSALSEALGMTPEAAARSIERARDWHKKNPDAGVLESMGHTLTDAVATFRAKRDAEDEANKAAHDELPWLYTPVEIAAGAASSLALPALGAGLKGALAAGGAYGAVGGLGGSKADLTKGEVAQAVGDTVVGGVVGAAGALAGHGVGRSIEVARRVKAAMGENKMIGALGEYLRKITERGGSPQAQKAAAGRLMNEARKAAGDTPLGVDNFMGLAKALHAEAQNPAAGGLSAEAKQILDAADTLTSREGGPSLTLTEMDNALKTWSSRIADWKNDPAKQRVAKMAAEALREDLEAATGDKMLGTAARVLGRARAEYGKAARAADLQKILLKAEDPKSVDKLISPSRFAVLNSGANRARVEKLLSDDPAALEAWQRGVDAAKLLAQKDDQWLPKQLTDLSPAAAKRMRGLMTYRNVSKIFGSAENAQDFARLVSPELGRNTKEAINIISRLSARLADDARKPGLRVAEDDPDAFPQDAQAQLEVPQ